MIIEKWKTIDGFEGIYQISNYGGVRTLRMGGKIMIPEKTRKGYLRVSLWKEGVRTRVLVHRLVAEAFIGKSDLRVNHKDLNKGNNHVRNLEFLSDRENTAHFRRSTGRKLPIGVRVMRDRFQARLNVADKVMYLGVYDTPEMASEAYQNALKSLSV